MNCTDCAVLLAAFLVRRGITTCRSCRCARVANIKAAAVRPPVRIRDRKRDWRAEYAARNAYLIHTPDPLTLALRAWPGGEPRTDWAAPVGRVCWRESLRMQA
jgi:hypothetical protein